MPNASEGLIGGINKANDWLQTRLNNIDIFDEHFQAEAQENPFYAAGGIFYLVWFIVILTGLLLMIWYIPTKAAAFDSILNIQHNIPFGNIIRGMHKYGADAMIIAATIRLYRMFLAADFKPSREFNIAIGLITLLLSMYSGLTGYLLIWNQRAFWATKVFATFPTYMDQFPVMGDFYLPLVKSIHMGWNTAEFLLGGGAAITQETITRFFSLHLAFSLIPLIFVELYFYRTGFVRIPINWIKRSAIIGWLIVVSIIMPTALGHRSNPDVTPLPILSDWYFLGLYQMYKYLEPVVATEITLVIPLTVMVLPFLDVWITGPEKDIMKRPLIFMVSLMALINWLAFSGLIIVNIANIHNDPPYWRDFLWMMVNLGVLMQLGVYMWGIPDVRQKIALAKGALTMAIVMTIQSVLAFMYFFMARTEMFFSPLTQAWTYGFFRIFMGGNADQAEGLVRKLVAEHSQPPYWFVHDLLAKGGDVPSADLIKQLDQVTQQGTILDGIFKLIPTFQVDTAWVIEKMNAAHIPMTKLDDVLKTPTAYGLTDAPNLVYRGMIDFMVTNRWMFDYVTFTDRMNGAVKPYPIEVPPLDWGWMIAGPVCAVLCYWAWWHMRNLSPQAATPPAAKQPTAAGTR
ncbi:MAG TPA: cytochrome b N-terminal domain-containing protein [Candidatus Obscuribacterales bacterium]